MTLKEIKAQFIPGQSWRCLREAAPIVVHGNLVTTVLPNKDPDEIRTVHKVATRDLVWLKPDGKTKLFSQWPAASNIIEARVGFFKFKYPGRRFEGAVEVPCPERDITITCTRQ